MEIIKRIQPYRGDLFINKEECRAHITSSNINEVIRGDFRPFLTKRFYT